MSPSTPSRSRSPNRSRTHGFLSKTLKSFQKLCGTRKMRNEPECRTIRTGNKELTVNLGNSRSFLQRMISHEPNTPEYRRVMRAIRNKNEPSPLRLPALSNRNFFRPHPVRKPSMPRGHSRNRTTNRLFGSPRPIGTRKREVR